MACFFLHLRDPGEDPTGTDKQIFNRPAMTGRGIPKQLLDYQQANNGQQHMCGKAQYQQFLHPLHAGHIAHELTTQQNQDDKTAAEG